MIVTANSMDTREIQIIDPMPISVIIRKAKMYLGEKDILKIEDKTNESFKFFLSINLNNATETINHHTIYIRNITGINIGNFWMSLEYTCSSFARDSGDASSIMEWADISLNSAYNEGPSMDVDTELNMSIKGIE